MYRKGNDRVRCKRGRTNAARTTAAVLCGAVVLSNGLTANAIGLKDVLDLHAYADRYPDLKAAFGYDDNALLKHYETYGIQEGRHISGLIDVVKYRETYPDLDAAFGDDWDAYVKHYLQYGAVEGRENFTDFNALDYVERYSDLKKAFGNDVLALYQHYETFGKKEHREARSEEKVQEEARREAAQREESNRSENQTSTLPENPGSSKPEIRIDPKTGEPFDLGGMEIIVADWWTGDPIEYDKLTEFGKAQRDYQEWLQETYNFTLVQKNYAGWGWGEGSVGEAFVKAATSGSDENIIYVLTNSYATESYVSQGLMYDISRLDGDVVDLSREKWTCNGELDSWAIGNSKYCFYAGPSEPRGGLYFNKNVLREAGIDPESIYDMQANGTWTWDKWVEIMEKVQRDTDGDGQIDVYGCVQNNGGMIYQCVRSNGGALVSRNSDGTFVLTADSDAVREGLRFGCNEVTAKYFMDYCGGDVSKWEEYKVHFMNGEAAFMYDDAYCAYQGGWLTGTSGGEVGAEYVTLTDENGNAVLDDNGYLIQEKIKDGYKLDQQVDYGFVMFPKGPNAADYVTNKSNNPVCMPSTYSDEKARLLMFAYDVWTDDVPGAEWEGYYGLLDSLYGGMRDTRSVEETIDMMTTRGVADFDQNVPDFNLNDNFLRELVEQGGNADVDAVLDQNLPVWQKAVDEFNAALGK